MYCNIHFAEKERACVVSACQFLRNGGPTKNSLNSKPSPGRDRERALQNMCCLPVHIPKGSSRGENDKQYDRQEKETFEGGVDLYFPVDEVII